MSVHVRCHDDAGNASSSVTRTITLHAIAPGDITGMVTDSSKVGLAGVEVTAHQADLGFWNYVRGVQTREDGSHDLGGLIR